MTERIKKEYIFLTAVFGLYMFEYMVTSPMLNQSAKGVLSASSQVSYYYIDMAFCVLGFVVYAAFRWIARNPKVHKIMMSAAALLYMTDIIMVFFLHTAKVYRLIAPMTMLCLGIMGGMIYYCMSRSLTDSGYMGRVMGVGGAAAMLLQYILQETADIPVVLLIALVTGLVVMGWLFYKLKWDWQTSISPETDIQTTENNSSLRISLICAVLITVSLLMLCQYYDSRMEIIAVQSGFEALNPYSWPRLCAILTYLVMGVLGDLKNGKYIPLFTLCAMLVSVLTPILLADADKYLLCMSLFYINVGVTISYYNLTFWRLAPRTGWPQLWAGMGRILDGLTGVTVFVLHIATLSVPIIIGIDIILLIGMIVAMVVSGEFALSPAPQEEAQQIKEIKELKEIDEIRKNPADMFDDLCEQYNFTEREKEVLQKLLFTEDDLQTIAEELYISRRGLSRHVSSIYQKTGAKSRIGLYQIYHSACQDT